MRNMGLDLSRGLLMIYIIIVIHGVFWLELIPRPYSTVILFEMPLIFLVSGYAFALTDKNKREGGMLSYWKFARSRVTRILVPYLAYAVICILIVIFLGTETSYSKIAISWINPLSYGGENTVAYLNSHLWFIPPFLLVTLAFPFFQAKIISKIPTEISLIFLCLAFVTISFLSHRLTTPAFYLIWSFLGYKIGSGWKVSNKLLISIAIGGFTILLVIKLVFHTSLDMQTNKFPPNYIFLVFSAMWVALALFVSTKVPKRLVDTLATNKFVKKFISHGYSLYLWQGLGYSIAAVLQQKMDINVISTWFLAIVATILLGSLAAPLEKMRWKQS